MPETGTKAIVYYIMEVLLETGIEGKVVIIGELLLETGTEGREDFLMEIILEIGTEGVRKFYYGNNAEDRNTGESNFYNGDSERGRHKEENFCDFCCCICWYVIPDTPYTHVSTTSPRAHSHTIYSWPLVCCTHCASHPHTECNFSTSHSTRDSDSVFIRRCRLAINYPGYVGWLTHGVHHNTPPLRPLYPQVIREA